MTRQEASKWLKSKGWNSSDGRFWNKPEGRYTTNCTSIGMAIEHEMDFQYKKKVKPVRSKFNEYYLSRGGVKSMLSINESLNEYEDSDIQGEFEVFCAGYFSAAEDLGVDE